MKPKLVRGTRDFSSEVVNKRNYIFSTLRSVFVKYGFNPLETPAMEELSTLTGKYGDEGDQLLFKILNNGDYLTGKKNNTNLIPFSDIKNEQQIRSLFYDLMQIFYTTQRDKTKMFLSTKLLDDLILIIKNSNIKNPTILEHFEKYLIKTFNKKIYIKKTREQVGILKKLDSKESKQIIKNYIANKYEYFISSFNKQKAKSISAEKLSKDISQRALRYDLTVPFARFVVLNRNDISFPYKRYQIQPVWRADKPQKGRYREFYQCDVDVIGSDSLLYEAELCQIYDEAFALLNLGVVIRLNNRKILDGLAQYAGYPELFARITVAIDKLDKIGWDGVEAELSRMGIEKAGFEKVKQVINAPDIATLKTLFGGVEIGLKGIEELETVQDFLEGYSFKNTLKIDFSLARGLSYYTGCIYEVEVDKSIDSQKDIKMGSIGGGGRYADLTGIFGLKDMSGVGVSFGAARIYDVMDELDLFETVEFNTSKVLFLAMDDEALKYGFKGLQKVRAAGISSTIYPKAWKFQKLMKYANKVKVPYVVIIGSKEMESGALGFKNMITGEQKSLSIEQIIEELK